MQVANDNWRNRDALTIAEAQEALRVSRSTINRMINSGRLTTFRVRRAVRIRVPDVIGIIDGKAAA